MNKYMVEVLDIALTNGLFVMLDNVACGDRMFDPQTKEHLVQLRVGTLALLFTLLGLAYADELAEESREKLREMTNQTQLYFTNALKFGTFEEPA